jgi:hypothetical protein
MEGETGHYCTESEIWDQRSDSRTLNWDVVVDIILNIENCCGCVPSGS